MKTRRVVMPTALYLLLAPSQALPQCPDWRAGPLDNGSAPNGTNSSVRAMTPWDPDGGGPREAMLVAAGGFTSIQGVSANHIAARDPATGLWQPLGSGTSHTVNALTVYNGELIAGGSFNGAGGQPANRVARWNGTSWQPLPHGANSDGTDGTVYALAVHNGQLIAGGAFTHAGGQPASKIAAWDAATGWQALSVGFVQCEFVCLGGQVNCLAQYGGELIAGGLFNRADGQPADNAARWNGSSWQPLGSGTNAEVFSLQVYNGELVAGGDFSQAGGQPANSVARWNGSTWQALGDGFGTCSFVCLGFGVNCLAPYGGELIAGGAFNGSGGQSTSRVARWNGASWQPLDSGISGGDVFSLQLYDGELVAGGDFSQAGREPANCIARWNGFQWAPFGGGSASNVLALANYRGRMVAAGDFHQSMQLGPGAHAIAGWDGVALQAFGQGMDNEVRALKAFKYPGLFGDYELVAGGQFTRAGGVAANYIARWDEDPFSAFPPPEWQAMGSGFNDQVNAIERYNGATYAGGAFTFSSQAVNHIARWNGTSEVWEPLGSGMSGNVWALKAYGGSLYAGGEFTSSGGVSTGGLARWNGTTWSQVGGFFNGVVYALEVHNGQLVIGGVFPGTNGSPNLAQYDGLSYSTLGTGGTDAKVGALHSTGGRLYIGGGFTTIAGVGAPHVAYWDGAWHEVAGGTGPWVTALASINGEVHAGGLFGDVDGGAVVSPCWARFLETGTPWIAKQPVPRGVDFHTTTSFSVEPADGYTELAFQWLKDGTPVSDGPTGGQSTLVGSGTPSLAIEDVALSDAGAYSVIVSNSCGSATSLAAALTVNIPVDAPARPLASTGLHSVHPNPFNPGTTIVFDLGSAQQASVVVFDLRGRRVRSLLSRHLPAGRQELTFDGHDETGRSLSSGTYFVRLSTAAGSEFRTITLLK